jgi:superfamily II DNA/RNA helicase
MSAVPIPFDAVADRDGPSFSSLGLPDALVESLARRGIDTPFPIQAATIADALAGRDLCGRAPTGSGKTLAFGIPAVLRTGVAEPHRPRTLVLVPTRELATQVTDEIQLLIDGLPRRGGRPSVQSLFGGVSFDRQRAALRRGVDIVVACPGRLADLVQQGACDLRDVDLVVVDEADRMSDMGFLPDVRRLLDKCQANRQTLLFSATLDGQVDVLIRAYQHDPVRHDHEPEDDAHERVTHLFWSVEGPKRLALTAAVIDRAGPTVVFCRTKRGTDRVARQLEAAGVRAAAIHGNRTQPQRERALAAFHGGQVQALVATDVAARGIHVDGVACVVHFDPPGDAKDYVHRSGRTARAGASGTVVSLVSADRRSDVGAIQRTLGYPRGVEPADLDAITPSGPSTRPARPARRRAATVASIASPRATAGPRRSTGPRKGAGSRKTTGPRKSRDPRAPGRGARGRSTTSPRASQDDRTNDRGNGQKAGRAPLPDGKRRPSGAARRKAKRLAANGSTTRRAKLSS